jgi:ADP-ribosyl-[dinitrogen reductase] hydrolase
VLDEARNNAGVSHSHPDGIKGAQAVAAAVFLARNGRTKEEIRSYIESEFRYNLQKSIEEIRPDYYYDQSCQGSVPESIIVFLDSADYESAIGLAGSFGGSRNSIASITGGIAQAYYKEIPGQIARNITKMLSPELYEIVEEFSKTYPLSLFRY